MDISMQCEVLSRIIEEESQLLEKFHTEEKKLKGYLGEKDWEKLQVILENIDRLSVGLALVEKERNRCFSSFCRQLKAGEGLSFYSMIARLPDDLKANLTEKYRNLKLQVLKVQGVTRNIESITSTLSDTIRNTIEELYPYRKGKIYCSKGKARESQMNPLVLNQQL